MFTIYEVEIEIEASSQKQNMHMQAPRIMIEQQFTSLIQQAVYSAEPVCLRLFRKGPVWSQYDQKWVERENTVEFMNKIYEAMKNENKN